MGLKFVRNAEQEILYNEIISKYNFNYGQEDQIRYGIIDGLDVSIYARPEFTAEQMDEIYQGIKDGLDVSTYAKPNLKWKQMEKIRLKLLTGK